MHVMHVCLTLRLSLWLSLSSEPDLIFAAGDRIMNLTMTYRLLLTILLCASATNAQTTVRGDLTSHVDSLIAAIPAGSGTGQYQPPGTTQQSQWRTMVETILQGDISLAAAQAPPLGYLLLDYTDTSTLIERKYYVLEKSPSSGNHWGTYVFAVSPVRPRLIIQVPHPLYDSKTGYQGWYVFFTVQARAFFLSGTHRCNNALPSPCSGTTTACGTSNDPYRQSDQAHVVDGTFQKSTEAALTCIDSCVFLQPHGFAQLQGDPDIIMSNGTQKAPPPGGDDLLALRDNLLLVDPSLKFKVAHVDTDWTRLIATTSTQGRLINGSSSPCGISATSANGRFLHLEQKYLGLRDTKEHWGILATAVGLTFPETPTTVQPAQDFHFRLFQNYPNPFNPATTIRFELDRTTSTHITIYNLLGQEVAVLVSGLQSPGIHEVVWHAERQPSGVYYCRLAADGRIVTHPLLLAR